MNKKLLYIGMKFDYGNKARGLSFEHMNFFHSLKSYCEKNDWDFIHYDFMEGYEQIGIDLMTEELYELAKKEMPDYLFAVLFDFTKDPRHEVFKRISELGVTTIHWFCDDHWRFEKYSSLVAPNFDFVCTTANSALLKYKKLGISEGVIKTQWACNHQLYEPVAVEKDIDVSFVGQPHGNRRQMLNFVMESGIDLKIFGYKWENFPRIPFNQMVRVFSRSKINLNLSNSSAMTGQQIKGRNFEIPGTKSFLLTSNAENLEEYYKDGKEIIIFNSPEELINKARYFLSHQTAREKIAENAYKRTMAEHTWFHRFDDIFILVQNRKFISNNYPKKQSLISMESVMKESISNSNSKTEPLFSVIIANYDNEKFIEIAIGSILNQSFSNWELIIVDDASTDNSVKIIEKYLQDKRIKLVRHSQNKGYTASLKTAIALVSSKIFGIVDSDDFLLPKAIETMYQTHIQYPDTGLIYSQFVFCDENLKPQNPGYCKEIPPNTSNLDIDGVSHFKTFKLDYYLKTSGYDESILFAEDKDISYKMEEVSKLKFINKILYCYRVLPDSQSNHPERYNISLESMAKAKENAVARRKQNNGNSILEKVSFEVPKETGRNNEFRLSVVLTTFNRIELLEQALKAFTNQSISKDQYQIIVVDDGSEPKAESCVNKFKDRINIIYTYHENKGLAFSRNRGIEYADYEIIAFADDDDIPSPFYVKQHLISHIKYPNVNVAVLGKLEWDNSIHVTTFMDYITRVKGDYLSFDNLIPGKFYNVWKWWGGLISCKKELFLKYKPVFDKRFRFGYEDTDLAIRMMNDNIKIIYNDKAQSYIIKKIESEEYFNRKIKQGNSLFLLEQKHGAIVTNRYHLKNALDEYDQLAASLTGYRAKLFELENSLSKLPDHEQSNYLNENPKIKNLLIKLYDLCIKGYLLSGYSEASRRERIQCKLENLSKKKLIVGLHSQTLYRKDGVVGGSEITTKGLKRAFEKYENVYKVIRYDSYGYNDIYDKLDLVVIEGWAADIPNFINTVRKKNKDAVIFFWNLSFWGLEEILKLPVDGFLTNSDQMVKTLSKKVPIKKVQLAADVDEIFPVKNVEKYSHDVVYLGMNHPNKSEEIISRMLVEASEFDLAIYGKGWNSHPYLKKFWKGTLPLGEINSLYSSAKIVIGITEDRQRKAGMINNRIFEAMACSSTFISEYFPELESVFGNLIYYSRKKGDTKKLISDILSGRIERKNPSELYDFIAKNHTYEERVKEIFNFYKEILDKRLGSNTVSKPNLKDNENPFISICIPTFNKANYFRQTIQSALKQNYDNYEIVVVNDGSTDNTEKIIKDFNSEKLKYFRKEHTNAPDTRNKCIKKANTASEINTDTFEKPNKKLLQTNLTDESYLIDQIKSSKNISEDLVNSIIHYLKNIGESKDLAFWLKDFILNKGIIQTGNKNESIIVSIVVPCFNYGKYLFECVESVLKQKYRNWEIIIIDDGSTDNTEDIAKKIISEFSDFHISYYKDEHRGLGYPRNYGIEKSKGKYILPLDADDFLLLNF